jgi:hypothetical protein
LCLKVSGDLTTCLVRARDARQMDIVEAEDKEARSCSPLDCIVVTYAWLVVLQGFSQWFGCLHVSYIMTLNRASPAYEEVYHL